jgi:parvulin-like peptidyl-prolyl isomerase
MRLFSIALLCSGVCALRAQTTPPRVPPASVVAADPVVVKINGKEWKKSELEQLIKAVGGPVENNFNSDRRSFLETLGLMMRLSEFAKEAGLDKKEPYASRLYYSQMQFFATALLNEQQKELTISTEMKQQYYDAHKKDFAIAKTKLIYISFSPPSVPAAGAFTRTEEQARAIVAKVESRLKAGEDFVNLVKEFSDDKDSKAKDGDFPPFKPGDDSLPPEARTVIFALKPGEVSAPVRQANGFYIFRLEEYVALPFGQVADDINGILQRQGFDKWIEGVRKSVTVEFVDPKFLTEGPLQH